jgi:hypothetical protein
MRAEGVESPEYCEGPAPRSKRSPMGCVIVLGLTVSTRPTVL